MIRWLAALLGLVILAVVTGAALLAWYDGERIRKGLTERLADKYGVVLNIDRLERSYSFRPKVTLSGLRASNAERESHALIQVDSARFRVHLFSLIFGPLTLDNVAVDGVKITLPVDEQGVMYWEPIVDALSTWLHRFDWSLPQFDVRDLTLQSRNRQRGNKLLVSAGIVSGTMPKLEDLKLSADDVEADLETALPLKLKGRAKLERVVLDRTDGDLPMVLTAGGRVEDESLQIEIKGGNLLAGDPLGKDPVRGTIMLGAVNVTFEGTMSRDDNTHMSLYVTLDRSDDSDSEEVGLTGDADISDPGEGWQFATIRLKRGSSRMSGGVHIEKRNGRRAMDATLHFRNVDFPGKQPDEEPSAETGTSVLPQGDLYTNLLDFVEKFDADVRLAAVESSIYGVPIQELAATATTRGGNFELAVDDATVLGGDLMAAFTVKPENEQTALDFEIALHDAGLSAFTSRSPAMDGVSGRFDGDIALHATGRETSAVVASLAGRTRFDLRQGAMPDKITSWMAGDIFSAMFTDFDEEDTTPVDCAIVEFEVDKGRAVAQKMILNTGSFTIHGEGEIDFKDRTMNLELVPSSSEFSLLSMKLPLRIRGPFDDISLDPNKSEAVISLLSPINGDDNRKAGCEQRKAKAPAAGTLLKDAGDGGRIDPGPALRPERDQSRYGSSAF